MKNNFTFLAILITILPFSIGAQLKPVGQWKDYSSHNQLISLEKKGNMVYAASNNGIAILNLSENTIEYLTKVESLSEIGLNTVAYSDETGSIIVGYKSGNLDVIQENKTTNLSDIKNSSIVGDKTIYSIYTKGNLAYLTTGFGIVALDLVKLEIKDTYIFGPSGTYLKVSDMTIKGDTIYAATNKGLYKAYENNLFLNDYREWTKITNINNSNGDFSSMMQLGSKIYVSYEGGTGNKDSIYFYNGSSWNLAPQVSGRNIINIRSNYDKLILNQYDTVFRFDSNLNQEHYVNTYDPYRQIKANDVIFDGTKYWIADNEYFLANITGNYDSKIYTGRGHYKNKASDIEAMNGNLWASITTLGGTNWNAQFDGDGLYHYDILNNEWTFYRNMCYDSGCIFDVVGVTIDPSNPEKAIACSFSDLGIAELRNGQVQKSYNENNSSLQVSLFTISWINLVDVADAAFDEDGNLWVANSWVNNPLSIKTPNGNWEAFYAGSAAKDRIISKIMVDKLNNYKWLLIKDQSILVYNSGETPTNGSDDQYQLISQGIGNGNLHSPPVCMAEDLDGEVWIGTEEGITVIYNSLNIFEGGDYDAQRIKIEQDGNVEYLLSTEYVTCIDVDGGNRKWIGTQASGVFVVSEDGQELIHHFTFENSPLYDNAVRDIAIDQSTGEVFVLTENGLLSYRGLATEGGVTFQDVYAFPNPVNPGYTGNVTITGLMKDSDVRITDLTGNIVYAGKSTGGQASWNRKNLDGMDVQSGVYIVYLAGPEGRKKEITKILLLD